MPPQNKITRVALVAAVLGLAAAGGAGADSFAPIGLPSARNPSPIFNRYASMPPFTALQPERGGWFLVPTFEIAQAMLALWQGDVLQYEGQPPAAITDFESWSLELPLSYGLSDRVSLEADLQAQFLWGGLLDGIIVGFHGLFGFPNGRRELVASNRVNIDVGTRSGIAFKLDRSAFLVSDPLLGAAFGLLKTPALSLTARAFAAVPLGLGAGFAGCDLPQAGAGLYLDWRATRSLGIYAAAAANLPMESFGFTETRPHPTAQFRLSGIIDLGLSTFLFVDLNCRTSPFDGDIEYMSADFFGLPSVDLLIGFMFSGGKAREDGTYGSFAVQEDPVSHNSTDVRFIGTGAFRIR